MPLPLIWAWAGGLSVGGFIKLMAQDPMIIIETARLILRHFHVFDAETLKEVFGDAEVMRFGLGVQTQQWIADWLYDCLENYYPKLGFGPWAVVEKIKRTVIGYSGLFYFPDI